MTLGVERVTEILSREIDIVMAQIGCSRLGLLGPHMLLPSSREPASVPSP